LLTRSSLETHEGLHLGGRQAPPPQGPASQPRAPGPHAPAPHPEKAGVGTDVTAAKMDSCFSTSALAQEGHETASPKRRTSFSKRFPQLQAYS